MQVQWNMKVCHRPLSSVNFSYRVAEYSEPITSEQYTTRRVYNYTKCARRHDVTILLLLLLLLMLLLLLYMHTSMSFTSSVFANNSTQKRDGPWRLKIPMQREVGNRNNDDVNEKFAFLFVDVFIYFFFYYYWSSGLRCIIPWFLLLYFLLLFA